MFEVVNAKVGRLPESDRAQVPRDLETTHMSLHGSCPQLVRSDRHVRFERSHSAVGPGAHRATCFLGIFQNMHFRENCWPPFEIWRR